MCRCPLPMTRPFCLSRAALACPLGPAGRLDVPRRLVLQAACGPHAQAPPGHAVDGRRHPVPGRPHPHSLSGRHLRNTARCTALHRTACIARALELACGQRCGVSGVVTAVQCAANRARTAVQCAANRARVFASACGATQLAAGCASNERGAQAGHTHVQCANPASLSRAHQVRSGAHLARTVPAEAQGSACLHAPTHVL